MLYTIVCLGCNLTVENIYDGNLQQRGSGIREIMCINCNPPVREEVYRPRENKKRVYDTSAYCKKYYQAHKKELCEKNKQYNRENKKMILEKKNTKISCECGSVVARGNMHTHRKTLKHTEWIANNMH